MVQELQQDNINRTLSNIIFWFGIIRWFYSKNTTIRCWYSDWQCIKWNHTCSDGDATFSGDLSASGSIAGSSYQGGSINIGNGQFSVNKLG